MPRLHGAKIIWIAFWIAIQMMYPFTRDIHYPIQQSAPHCCSLLSHCFITIYIISGLKLSRRDPGRVLTRDKYVNYDR